MLLKHQEILICGGFDHFCPCDGKHKQLSIHAV